MEIRSKGRVLGYSDDVAAGVIQAEDGNKYQFDKTELRSKDIPAVKDSVTFVMRSGRAVQIEGD